MHNRPLDTLIHPHHVSLLPSNSSTLQTLYHGLDDRLTPANFSLDHGHAHRNLGVPRFNVRETKSSYVLHGEVPGVRELADVAVEWLQGRVLLIHGAVPVEDEEDELVGEEDTEHHLHDVPEKVQEPRKGEMHRMGSGLCHAPKHLKAAVTPDGRSLSEQQQHTGSDFPATVLSERQVGQFQRSFTFPIEVEPDLMKKKLEHGLLVIILPKKSEVKKVPGAGDNAETTTTT